MKPAIEPARLLGGALVAAVIGLGRRFGLRVVAEGVETEAQARYLIERGCSNQQGYLFARPMPSADFESLLASRAGLVGFDINVSEASA